MTNKATDWIDAKNKLPNFETNSEGLKFSKKVLIKLHTGHEMVGRFCVTKISGAWEEMWETEMGMFGLTTVGQWRPNI